MQMLTNLEIEGLTQIIDQYYDAQTALAKVKESLENGSHHYGLVITDISMPIMDGYELSEEIRSFYREHEIP